MGSGGTMNLLRRVRRTTLAVMVTACAVGCASTVAGTAQPGLTAVDLSTLETGPYRPEPTAYEPSIDGVPDIRLIEARRMLGHLVHADEVDPEIDTLGDLAFFWNGQSMAQSETFPPQYQPAADHNNLIAGVYVSRTNGDLRSRKKLIISVLRFPTDAASRQAAAEFDQITHDAPDRHPIAVPDRPDARTSSADDITAVSFLAHGAYVIMVNAAVPQPDPGALAAMIDTTLDLQTARLDRQQPVPMDDLLDIPADPDGIMRRALPTSTASTDPFFGDDDFGAFTPAGQLHFERDPARVRRAFEESGVDLVGRRAGVVYRARDLAGAFRLQSVLAAPGRNDEELPPPPGLVDARCLRLDDRDPVRHYDGLCVVVHGRYVAVVVSRFPASSRIDQGLYERAAAQYAILAESE
ncbi:hypothetical protein IU411_16020 [Nocardia farcinica]|nr:hypothetical protein [Nocardia farcinica]